MKIKKFDQINVLPFIDIMLVLLVIVLTSASFVSKGTIPIDLPKAGEGKKAVTEKMKTIVINKQGVFYFESKKVNFEKLKQNILNLDPKKDTILIKSDAKSQFQNFVKVIDFLKTKGFEKISIETQKE
ncbi:biopolymer transporter ExbD [Hydrogenimonas thermophila]|uniref:ExbD/TolR family protein n=1 Tax=Hydrogenimonas thermophila TaxID=223786 RepID=UPI0029370642|nr:biopolymer transporter ExbD [Hydrogenimonas thermophila]WOE70470.1 biopolymer transporter ExbD [Hydrogenimonas thermophila]WOE72987.1 biopolymer transporter ExbD [Hydrogenimonas thermophila]